jgi:NarL family two-component system response regulator LiaR
MTLRLLLADDHPLFRAGVRSLLDEQPDMEIVAEAEDGVGAVEAARKHKPDVVVTDVSMPGMTGLEAARRITTEAPEIKVLCLSMHTDSRFVKAAFRSGARGYLLKECALADLVAAIHAVSAGQIYVSPGLADTVMEGYGAEGSESSALDLLTPREREVLQLLAEGHPAQAIASRLKVSVKTVGTHREHLMHKLGTHSLPGLTKFAIREGVTLLEE